MGDLHDSRFRLSLRPSPAERAARELSQTDRVGVEHGGGRWLSSTKPGRPREPSRGGAFATWAARVGAGPWRAVLLIAAILVSLAFAARADALVYWADYDNGTIGRANLDGTGLDQSFITSADFPVSVAVDASHIYWANEGLLSGTTIGRANLDGTDVDQSFITGANSPGGVAVDASHVYWTNELGDSIGRANLDGSGVDQSFINAGDFPCGPAVDASHIYWANALSGTIRRANLNGTQVNRHLVDPGFGTCSVAVDAAHVYWAGVTSIGRARLNGKRAVRNFIASESVTTGVAVDGAQIYWANFDGTIGRANLDGTGRNHTFICGSRFSGGVAVDALFMPPPQSPSSDVSFCPVKRNERKGTSKLAVNVDGPGKLELAKTTKVKGDEQTVEAAGTHELLVKPKGKAKRRLNKTGRATVEVRVIYTPTGGSPRTEGKSVKLVSDANYAGHRATADDGGDRPVLVRYRVLGGPVSVDQRLTVFEDGSVELDERHRSRDPTWLRLDAAELNRLRSALSDVPESRWSILPRLALARAKRAFIAFFSLNDFDTFTYFELKQDHHVIAGETTRFARAPTWPPWSGPRDVEVAAVLRVLGALRVRAIRLHPR